MGTPEFITFHCRGRRDLQPVPGCVTTAPGTPSPRGRVGRLECTSPEKADGFSCLAIVSRVVTATPFLSKDSRHQEEVSQPVPDTPLQHQEPDVSLCLPHLQEVLGLSTSKKTGVVPNKKYTLWS